MNTTDMDDDTATMIAEAAQAAVALMPETKEGTEMGLVIGGVAAAICSIIYAMKHIKSSSCLGARCQQAVEEPTVVVCPDGQRGVVVESNV